MSGPKFFIRPAADLVAQVDVRDARAILDVGTGSGIAARAARDAAAADAEVTGIDASIEMLRTARSSGLARVAVATVPGLPFAGATFDRVIASFVLSHVESYEAALSDMARVLRPDGRLGITAWGDMQFAPRELWDSLTEARIGKDRMAEAVQAGIPWEHWFTDPKNMRRALAGAGLRDIDVEYREYEIRMTRAEFLATRQTSLSARFLKQALGAAEWERFWQEVVGEFERRFGEELVFSRDVWIGTGRKG